MKNCLTNGCLENRTGGDMLFCFNCRTEWITICNQYFGVEVQANEMEVSQLLINFQGRLLN